MHLVAFDGAEPPRGAPPQPAPRRGAPPFGTEAEPPRDAEAAAPPLLALVIGQTPREDLIGPLSAVVAEAVGDGSGADSAAAAPPVVVRGALDGTSEVKAAAFTRASLERSAAPEEAAVDAGDCPLITRLSSGAPVTVREAELVPLLQAQLDAHAAALPRGGGGVALLLCAGAFAGLRAPSPAVTLLKPFEVAAAMASHLGAEPRCRAPSPPPPAALVTSAVCVSLPRPVRCAAVRAHRGATPVRRRAVGATPAAQRDAGDARAPGGRRRRGAARGGGAGGAGRGARP